MPLSNLTPLSVVEYQKGYIIDFVRHKTGWSERNEVSQKTQLIYLDRYLKSNSIKCETIIAEDEYIDRHFLEDYAEYYARCFPSHPRKCSRLHFFSTSFNENEFKEALASNDSRFIADLQKNYLGFAVIRPIPHTFFAKLCLRPFDAHTSKFGRKILKKTVSVSLFGINLSIETIPFIEQDKVVSACATSALWTALSASKDAHVTNLPSPSAITKSANEGTKVFPTTGLTPPQVARSLAYYGFTPTVVYLSQDDYINDLKEQIYAYINSETPLILGGDVYEHKNKDEDRYLGKHLVCVVGYNIQHPIIKKTPFLSSHTIDKIYIHDDRIGPFIKVKSDLSDFEHAVSGKLALVLKVDNIPDNYFIPDVLIIGLNHKVRILYDHIREICAALQDYLTLSTEDIRELLSKSTDLSNQKNQSIYQSLSLIIKNGVWDIFLTTSAKIKEELRSEPSFWSFNGLTNKTFLLFQNLPKHIWRCRIHKNQDQNNELFTDILFDATEIPQGKLMVGYITYSKEAQEIWHYVETEVRNRIWQNYQVTSEYKSYIGCIIKFFSQSGNNAIINTMYGPLGLPRRKLKPGETDDSENISQRTDVFTIRPGSTLDNFIFLNKDKKYIWVINELGDIVIGEDIVTTHEEDEDNEFKGHPTLIDGKPGRIAGELFYDHNDLSWKANLKSRAYSGHIKKNSDEYEVYLKNVIDINLKPLGCKKSD